MKQVDARNWRNTSVKLYFLFAVIDILIILVYPFVYVFHQIRRMMGVK